MEASDTRQLRGVGGWLLFFLLTFAVFTPIRTGIEVFVELGNAGADPDAAAGAWLWLGAYLIFTWAITAWFVLVRRWSSVLLMIAVMWLETLFGIASLVFLPAYEGAPADGALIGFQAVTAFVYPTIWTAYLLKSVRVANTYPRRPGDEDLPQVFE